MEDINKFRLNVEFMNSHNQIKNNNNYKEMNINLIKNTNYISNEIKTKNKERLVSLIKQNKMTSEEKLNFGNCKVCKDIATGIHYGAPTCESCKVFFKRGMNKFSTYICQYGKNCFMSPKMRKKCKYCRWQSCLLAGMSYDAIKIGRKSRVDRELLKSGENDNKTDRDIISQNESTSSSLSSNEENNILAYSEKKYIPNMQTRKDSALARNLVKINKSFLNKAIDFNMLNSKYYITDSYLSMPTSYINKILKQYYSDFNHQYELLQNSFRQGFIYLPAIHNLQTEFVRESLLMTIYEFTKSTFKLVRLIPGFDRINICDLGNILKNRIFSIFGLATARLLVDDEFYLIISNNIRYSKYWMAKCLSQEICDGIFAYHYDLNNLNLSDQELALLVAIVLTLPDSNFVDPETIKELNEFYTSLFCYEMSLKKRIMNDLVTIHNIIEISQTLTKMIRDIELKRY